MSRLCYCLALLFGFALPAFGQGVVIGPDHRPAGLTLEAHHVRADVQEQVAVVTVEHRFRNTSRATVEGTFLFPLPPGAQVSAFEMEADGQTMTGEVLAADEARGIYEAIVRQSLDPALLEMADYRTFRARVFPIPPGATRTLTLRYDATLALAHGTVTFQYPLQGHLTTRPTALPMPHPRPGMRPEEARPVAHTTESSFRLNITTTAALKNLYSPSHNVDIRERTDRRAVVTLDLAKGLDGRDFIFYYSLDPRDIGATLLTHRPYRDQDGYFMLLLAPPLDTGRRQVQPKDIVFVLDTSGSMAGDKIDQAKDALRYTLNRLGDRDRFGIVSFSSDVEPFRDALASPDIRDDALYFVDGLEARGGTNINEALLTALAMLDGCEHGMILFLTDGLPSSGITDEGEIRKNVAKANKAGVRLFPFGVGYDVNTRLLDGLARSAEAFADYISPDENIEERISTFYERVRYPVMTDVRLAWEGVQPRALAPRVLPDLYRGGQLIVAGRYDDPGKATLTLTGSIDGRTERRRYTFDFPDRERERDFVARLWATRRVGQLLDEIRINGENDELKGEVIALAKAYGLVTPYTSYLVQEDEAMAQQAVPAPQGVLRRFLGQNAPASVRAEADSQQGAPGIQPMEATTGQAAVQMSKAISAMQQAETVAVPSQTPNQVALQGRVMVQDEEGAWIDLAFDAEADTPVQIRFASDAYFALLRHVPEVAPFVRLGPKVTFYYQGTWVQVGDEGKAALTAAEVQALFTP